MASHGGCVRKIQSASNQTTRAAIRPRLPTSVKAATTRTARQRRAFRASELRIDEGGVRVVADPQKYSDENKGGGHTDPARRRKPLGDLARSGPAHGEHCCERQQGPKRGRERAERREAEQGLIPSPVDQNR